MDRSFGWRKVEVAEIVITGTRLALSASVEVAFPHIARVLFYVFLFHFFLCRWLCVALLSRTAEPSWLSRFSTSVLGEFRGNVEPP